MFGSIARFGILLLVGAVAATAVSAQQFTTIGQLGVARQSHVAIYIGDGKVLVMGGSIGIPETHDPRAIPVATCDIVDVWNRRVTPAASMIEPRAEFAAVLTPDSNVIVIGGATGNDPNGAVTARVELYDRARGTWRSLGRLTTPRRQHVAGYIDDHRILVVGGRAKNYTSLTNAEIFDTRTGTSAPAASFPYPINASTLLRAHSGDLVVVGGRTGGANSERRAEVYAYDADADEWVLGSVLAKAVSGVSGIRLWDGRSIVAGGLHADLPGESASEMQLENVGKWKLVSMLLQPRTNAAVVQWSENRVLVVGGFHDDRVPVATTEWIDMSGHASVSGPSLAVARDRFAALSIPAGPTAAPHERAVVVIGGLRTMSDLTASVEVLLPSPSMLAPLERAGGGRSLVMTSPRSARVGYVVAARTPVSVEVTARDGRVLTTVRRDVEAGEHEEEVSLAGATAGEYLVRLTVAGERRTWPVVIE